MSQAFGGRGTFMVGALIEDRSVTNSAGEEVPGLRELVLDTGSRDRFERASYSVTKKGSNEPTDVAVQLDGLDPQRGEVIAVKVNIWKNGDYLNVRALGVFSLGEAPASSAA